MAGALGGVSACGRGASRATGTAGRCGPSWSRGGLMQARRLTATDAELAVLCEALRECIAAELLSPSSVAIAPDCSTRSTPSSPAPSTATQPVPAAGRLMAGDEILRLLLTHEDRYSYGALTNEQIAAELDWKPAGVSVRQLLEELAGRRLAGRGREPSVATSSPARARPRPRARRRRRPTNPKPCRPSPRNCST